MKLGRPALKRTFSDLPRKKLTDGMFSTLIDSLWRDPLALYSESVKPTPSAWLRNTIDPSVQFGQALGQDHQIFGNKSIAMGMGNITRSMSEIVIGAHSTDFAGSANAWTATDRLFELGNGVDAANRSYALRTYKSGYTHLNNALRLGEYSWGANNPQTGSIQFKAGNFEGYNIDAWNRFALAADNLVDKDLVRYNATTKRFERITPGTEGQALVLTSELPTWSTIIAFPGFGIDHTHAAYGDHDHSTVYAPISGSANYVNVSPASAQSGNIWLAGNGKFETGLTLSRGAFSPITFTDGTYIRALARIEDTSGDFSLFQYGATGGYLRQALSILNSDGAATFVSTLDATGYKLSGVLLFLDWLRTGYAGTSGQYLKSQGISTTPIWTDFPTSLPASDVYAWAKEATKPSYTYSEVGAAASGHTHDYSGVFAALSHNHTGTYEPVITKGTTLQYFRGDMSLATMPTTLPASDVYAWAKEATKPSYTYSEVGAAASGHTHSGVYDNYNSWGVSVNGGASAGAVSSGNIVNFYGSGGITTSRSGNDITITGSGSMVYPGAGIPLSTGSAWGTSITNNSANWNTAYGWGNHASAGYLTSQTSHADVLQDGDFASQGIMLRGVSSGSYSILTDASANWNSAYSNIGIVKLGTAYGYLNITQFYELEGSVGLNVTSSVTNGSNTPFTSGGAYTALALKANLSGCTFTGHVAGTTLTCSGLVKGSEVERGSSRDLKTNIKRYEGNALDILNATSINTYNLKTDGSFGIGFMAEDTHKWLSGEDQKSHLMGNHLGLLTKAIQEEDLKITRLQQEIIALKSEINRLKNAGN